MTDIKKRIGLLGFIAKGLIKADAIRTKSDLGDRSTYVGMSDIASKCRRSVVAGKVYGQSTDSLEDLEKHIATGNEAAIQDSLRQMVTFGRGHVWESVLGKGFDALGVMRIPQLEVRYLHEGTPINIHVDDVFVFPDGSVRVLEHKCNEQVQDALFPENELQLKGQLGFIHGLWHLPCFGVKRDGKYLYEGVSFPDLVRSLFGFDIPSTSNEVCIEGYVISATLNPNKTKRKTVNPHGPYVPEAAATQECLDRAKWIWKDMQDVRNGKKTIDDLRFTYGVNPLCDFCEFCDGCPKFSVKETPELESFMAEWHEKNQELKRLEAEIEEFKETFAAEYSAINKAQTCFGEEDTISFLQAGPYKGKVSKRAGWKNLNKGLLSKALTNLSVEQLEEAIQSGGFTSDMIDGIIDSATKQGDPFTVVTLNKLKNPQKAKAKAKAA